MIRLTFSPEFPSRTVKVGHGFSRGDKRSSFFVATVFPGLRGDCVSFVGGGHPSNCVMSWVANLLTCTSRSHCWFYMVLETGDPLLILVLTHILDTRTLGRHRENRTLRKMQWAAAGRRHSASTTRFKSFPHSGSLSGIEVGQSGSESGSDRS
jgi:hypothetical protein